jgi:hypothetical protein
LKQLKRREVVPAIEQWGCDQDNEVSILIATIGTAGVGCDS